MSSKADKGPIKKARKTGRATAQPAASVMKLQRKPKVLKISGDKVAVNSVERVIKKAKKSGKKVTAPPPLVPEMNPEEKPKVPQNNVDLIKAAIEHLGDKPSGYCVKFLRQTIREMFGIDKPKKVLKTAVKTLVKEGFLVVVGGEPGMWMYFTKMQLLRELQQLYNIQKKMTVMTPAWKIATHIIGEKFSRVNLLMTKKQLVEEGYPLPVENEKGEPVFANTTKVYRPVETTSKMFSLGGEAWGKNWGRGTGSLQRIVIVEEKAMPVPIYSGVIVGREKTAKMWRNGVTLKDVRDRITELVTEYPDCILVGHELNKYLHLLKMTHPYCIDTSVVFKWLGQNGEKPELKALIEKYVDDEDLLLSDDFSPEEEAIAAMKLVKMELMKGNAYTRSIDPKAKASASSKKSAVDEKTATKGKNEANKGSGIAKPSESEENSAMAGENATEGEKEANKATGKAKPRGRKRRISRLYSSSSPE